MSIFIKVKQERIESAIKANSRHCMIADAIHEHMPHVKAISVDTATIRFSNPKTRKRYIYLTPPIAQQMILRFDAGEKITPFSFSLNDKIVREAVSKAQKTKRIEIPETEQTFEQFAKSFLKQDPTQTSNKKVRPKKKVSSNYRLAKTLPMQERQFGLRRLVGTKLGAA